MLRRKPEPWPFRSIGRRLRPSPFQKGLLFGAGAMAFVLAAATFEPSPSAAGDAPGPAPRSASPRAPFRARPPAAGAPLGELIGGRYLVRITLLPQGPRYTVCTPDGEVLATDLPADEVYRDFPDLDPAALHLGPDHGPGTPLMLAEPTDPG